MAQTPRLSISVSKFWAPQYSTASSEIWVLNLRYPCVKDLVPLVVQLTTETI